MCLRVHRSNAARAATNKWKYVLHTMVVVNHPWGKHVPVAWLLSKYEDHGAVRDWMDRFGLLLGAAEGAAPYPYAPYEFGDNAPRVAGTLVKEHVMALGRFCPSHILIDVSATEVLAINESMWGRGVKGPGGAYVLGIGLTKPEHIPCARIVYCDWHIKKAWSEQAKEKGVKPDDRDLVMEGLAALVDLPVRRGARFKAGGPSLPWVVRAGPGWSVLTAACSRLIARGRRRDQSEEVLRRVARHISGVHQLL